MRRFNAMVIDPQPESRAALKELLHNEQLYQYLVYQGVYLVGSFIDAVTRLSEEEPIDVMFISSRFPIPEIDGFIRTARDSEQRGGTAYILVLGGGDQMGTLVAQAMAVGVDGFLILPCSVEQLRDITLIAQKVKAAAHDRMLKVALSLLIDTLLGEVDSKIQEYYQSGRPGRFRKQIKEATTNLVQGNEEARSQYFVLLEEAVGKARPAATRDAPSKSKRVQKLLEQQRKRTGFPYTYPGSQE